MNKESGTTGGIFEQLTGATVYYTFELDNYIECHGCSGKGWIENSKGELKVCPICEGEGKLGKEKNNLPCYPWYPWPNRMDDPCWPTYPIITYCNTETDNCTCCNIKIGSCTDCHDLK